MKGKVVGWILTAYAAASKFISQPILQTEGLCSTTKVTAIAWTVPIKHTREVRLSWWFL